MIEIEIVPIIKDNYVFIIHSPKTDETAIIDPGDAGPPIERLKEKGWKADKIFITHHHWDHTDGVLDAKEATDAEVIGFEGDAHRIPGIDKTVKEGEEFEWGGEKVRVIFAPGHTTGLIIYHFYELKIAFVNDLIFAMGCGRVFEGTFEQAYESLQLVSEFPDDTLLYCTHEYTLTNAEFALTVDPDNKDLRNRYEEVKEMRKNGEITIPTNVAIEKKTNPFLRAPNVEEFALIRNQRNKF